MEIFSQVLGYIQNHSQAFGTAATVHLQLSFFALFIAAIVCIPLGILTSRYGRIARIIINGIGIARVIPSIAVLLVLLPVLGVGFVPSLVALILLAFPPILINTDTGMRGVNPATLEAARGLGMTRLGSLWEVELPLALPVIIGGLRTATVEVIASATLATFIGGGGFGDFITQGLSANDNKIVLAGAIPVALLALFTEILWSSLQRYLSPKGLATFKTT